MKEEKEKNSMGHQEITWTEEALRRVENAPEFVRPGIRKLMVLRARERNYKTITSEFLTEIRNESMLRVSKSIKKFGFEELRKEAFDVAKKRMRRNARKVEVIGQIEDFLARRTSKNKDIMEKFKRYLEIVPEVGIPWTEEALQRLERIPVFARVMAKKAIEEEAKRHKQVVISPFFLDQVLKELLPKAMELMAAPMEGKGPVEPGELGLTLAWDPEPLERIQRIPISFIRQRIISRVEEYAKAQRANRVTIEIFTAARFLDRED
ncbi:MAG: PCP reductase family protein [Candidatus Binatia bacterium]